MSAPTTDPGFIMKITGTPWKLRAQAGTIHYAITMVPGSQFDDYRVQAPEAVGVPRIGTVKDGDLLVWPAPGPGIEVITEGPQ